MDLTLPAAITHKQLVEFWYDGCQRVVEPHTYGVDKKFNEVLSGWQTVGKPGDPPAWRLYEVSKMTALHTRQQSFANARQGYKRNDPRMTTIYAQL